jgi:ABC-type transport system substrate-binding protein
VAGILVLACGAAACGGGGAGAPSAPEGAARRTAAVASGGIVRLGVTGPLVTDPLAANEASAAQMAQADLLFDGLTAYDSNSGQIVGALADGWDVLDGGARWRFHLRSDATFATGEAVTPADVIHTFERVANRGVQSVVGVRLDVIDGWSEYAAKSTRTIRGLVAVDAHTVDIQLRTPFSPLAELLASPALGIVRSDAPPAPAPTTLSASGPFTVSAHNDDEVTLARRTGASAQTSADGFVVHRYADAAALSAATASGTVDIAYGVTASGTLVDASVAGPTSVFYAMNLASGPLSSLEVRQAILKTVDRDALRQSVYGASAVTLNGLIGVGINGHRDSACGSACAVDPAIAKALVAKVAAVAPLTTVHVDYFDEVTGNERKLADGVVAALVAVGIPAEVRAHGFAEFGAFVASGKAELFRYGWTGTYPSPAAFLSTLFEAKGADNVFSLADDQTTALLMSARTKLTESDRRLDYLAVEDRIFAQAVVLPIAEYRVIVATSPAVRDLTIGPLGAFDVTRVWTAQ